VRVLALRLPRVLLHRWWPQEHSWCVAPADSWKCACSCGALVNFLALLDLRCMHDSLLMTCVLSEPGIYSLILKQQLYTTLNTIFFIFISFSYFPFRLYVSLRNDYKSSERKDEYFKFAPIHTMYAVRGGAPRARAVLRRARAFPVVGT
jgi:hypothetical protein